MLCELPPHYPYSDFLTVLIPQNSRLAVPSSTRMQTHNLKSQQSLPLSDSSRFQVFCTVILQLGDYLCQQVNAFRRSVRVLFSFFSPLSNEVLGHSSLFFLSPWKGWSRRRSSFLPSLSAWSSCSTLACSSLRLRPILNMSGFAFS